MNKVILTTVKRNRKHNYNKELRKMNDNHHYLPKFYLNGFLDENEQLYYCKKEYESYRHSAPAGIYYIKGLNDIDLGEYGHFDLEKEFFKEKDNRYARAFIEMREKYHYNINDMPLQVKADIVEFVLGLYWRVPGGLHHVIDLIAQDGLLTGDLELYNKESGKVYTDDEVPEIIADIKAIENNQKVFMPIFYEENVRKHDWGALNEKFFIYETWEPLLIGDIPYVPLKHENKRGKILDEFMIPLDKNHILIYAKKHPRFFENTLLGHFIICIIDGASEKITCSDLQYLKDKIKICKPVIEKFRNMGVGSVKEKLLAPFIEYQSMFDSFEDYKKTIKSIDHNKVVTTELLNKISNRFQ